MKGAGCGGCEKRRTTERIAQTRSPARPLCWADLVDRRSACRPILLSSSSSSSDTLVRSDSSEELRSRLR